MRHLFIMDKVEDESVDTSSLLISEARRRGHEVEVCGFLDVELTFVDGKCESLIDGFDVVWLRKDPPVDDQFIQHLQMMILGRGQVFFVNDPLSVLRFNEKLAIFNFEEYMPETLVSAKFEEVRAFVEKRGDAVVKPLNGFSGIGVRHVKSVDEIGEIEGFVMVQEFLPEVLEGDIRVHIVGGEILAAMRRVPANGDFRVNIHAGGSGQKIVLSDEIRGMANEIGKFLVMNGIFFAGIDIIGGKLNEINVTSPGILVETNEVDGANYEVEFFDRLERYV